MTDNLRGLLSKLSHPAFVQTLYYETGSSPCYNGNISRMQVGVIATEPACKWRKKVLK